ncbi:MAG: glycoside hydrolase family protein [Smithella sp.]
MDRQAIENQLKIDEGVRNTTYLDSLGKLTVGIGHLITPADNIPAGSTLSDERIDQLFQADLDQAIKGATGLFPKFLEYPEPIQEAIINITFNIGAHGLSQFHHFIAAVMTGDWDEAANQLIDSTWFHQVGKRAVRIVASVQSCADNIATA